ncbi:YggT family protein [Aggregatibacter actinomycetemcomitans]|uniref:YggT family protein n=1 Tax=Aggregatibacter actinomycetemcomitans TaxID=714 RepID=UPI0011DC676F|nr:YggT family protein [Aggregatibacter actinomycetemcomitans]TYA16173.1 YggT family protein [Aggregatibacter actinomycetemcomitans]TYA33109.1 YggT family protein [Aggregatibacter actinomycetemcomitans]TYB01128.1 YggT family protein [Aggregatibacter actinomycetemcomitans]TYB15285.1 YggT family protein [Aggregatibacter actinomycetemcomitans]TYB16232.1 YggT family protein [Aggregatibacter actinomycetemcomitans]
MNSIQFLIATAISVYSFILILRTWFQLAGVDFYNPLSQALVKATQPVVVPLSKLAPTVKGVNTAALLACFILGLVKFPLLNLFGTIGAASLFEYAIIGVLSVVHSIGEAIFYVLLVGAILSWFNRGASQTQYLLYQLSEPVLRPVRKILPNTGMIDFSPMVVVFVLYLLNRVLYDMFGGLWVAAAF